VTISDVSFTDSYEYTYTPDLSDNEVTAILNDSNSIYAEVSLTVENKGDTALTSATPELAEGSLVESVPEGSASLDSLEGLSETPFTGSVEAGSTASGVALYELPYEIARGELKFTWGSGADSPPTAIWKVPPQSGESRDIPEFEVKSVSVPKTATAGKEISIRAVVENVGDRRGTFHGQLVYKSKDMSEYYLLEAVSAEIPPGESRMFETTSWFAFATSTQYGLYRYDTKETTTFELPSLELGEAYSTIIGHRIKQDKIRAQDFNGFTYYSGGETYREAASGGSQLVFVYVSSQNTSDSDIRFPSYDQFHLVDGEDAYETVYPIWSGDKFKIETPIEGMTWGVPGTVSPGAAYRGWLIFEIPSGLSRYDVALEAPVPVNDSTSIMVRWENPEPNN